jgi:hypothetical protein
MKVILDIGAPVVIILIMVVVEMRKDDGILIAERPVCECFDFGRSANLR